VKTKLEESAKRTVKEVTCKKIDFEIWGQRVPAIRLEFRAKGFLQYMVRTMVGVAILGSQQKITLDQMRTLLSGDKSPQSLSLVESLREGMRAPANGLTLEKIVWAEGTIAEKPSWVEWAGTLCDGGDMDDSD